MEEWNVDFSGWVGAMARLSIYDLVRRAENEIYRHLGAKGDGFVVPSAEESLRVREKFDSGAPRAVAGFRFHNYADKSIYWVSTRSPLSDAVRAGYSTNLLTQATLGFLRGVLFRNARLTCDVIDHVIHAMDAGTFLPVHGDEDIEKKTLDDLRIIKNAIEGRNLEAIEFRLEEYFNGVVGADRTLVLERLLRCIPYPFIVGPADSESCRCSSSFEMHSVSFSLEEAFSTFNRPWERAFTPLDLLILLPWLGVENEYEAFFGVLNMAGRDGGDEAKGIDDSTWRRAVGAFAGMEPLQQFMMTFYCPVGPVFELKITHNGEAGTVERNSDLVNELVHIGTKLAVDLHYSKALVMALRSSSKAADDTTRLHALGDVMAFAVPYKKLRYLHDADVRNLDPMPASPLFGGLESVATASGNTEPYMVRYRDSNFNVTPFFPCHKGSDCNDVRNRYFDRLLHVVDLFGFGRAAGQDAENKGPARSPAETQTSLAVNGGQTVFSIDHCVSVLMDLRNIGPSLSLKRMAEAYVVARILEHCGIGPDLAVSSEVRADGYQPTDLFPSQKISGDWENLLKRYKVEHDPDRTSRVDNFNVKLAAQVANLYGIEIIVTSSKKEWRIRPITAGGE